MNNKYIPALDGLRALAVFAVVLYHMVPAILPCGLLGVTLFFVLSGYLITGILLREWHTTSTIKLGQFWLHRVRRLLPAIVLCLLVTALLTGIFAPDLLTKLRRDLLAALFWFSNWWYILLDQSYFEAAGAPSPVTHFWSLAIEEQFYLIWPPLLLLLLKSNCKRGAIQGLVLVFALISAVLMAVMYNPAVDPTRVYYGTDTRAFSLLIGVWLAFAFPMQRLNGYGFRALSEVQRTVIGWAGLPALAGIIACMALIDTYSSVLYYGGNVLVSILAAVLILSLIVPNSLVSALFSRVPIVWIGKISYGIYIWHFPLLLLMNDVNSTSAPNPLVYLGEIAVICVVASLSYVFVEQPIRQGRLGEMWRSVRTGLSTWTRVITHHLLQILGTVALVGGASFALIVVPDTATQQFATEETPLEAIVPEGALGGEDTTNTEAEAQANESEGARDAMLAKLGPCESLSALSDATLQQLINTPGNTPKEKAQNTQFIMIGDSVSAAFSEKFYGGFSAMFPNAILDAAYNRRVLAGIPVLDEYLEQGWNGPVVVFELATNGSVTVEELDQLIAAVPEGKMIFIANARSSTDIEGINNKHIYTAAANHPNVQVLDWYANSMNRDYYFDGDGTHLTPQSGRDAYLNMVLVNLETLYQ